MNPPYGRGTIDKWIDKAITASQAGATVVALLPARTDTRWFWQVFEHAAEIRFIKGRIRFGDATDPAPFPSCIAVFRPAQRWAGPAGTTYTTTTSNRSVSMVTVLPIRTGTHPDP